MIDILNTTLGMAVRMSTPYLFAALGGMMAQHCGVYNFALEGMMLGGAFFGYFFTWMTGSLFIGVLGAVAVGFIFGWLMAFIFIRFGVSQMVICLGMNTLFIGITGYCARLLNMGAGIELRIDQQIGNVFNGFMTKIPVLGNMVLNQNILTYLVIALFVFYAWFIKRTSPGLALRSVGENPAAAQSAGINVYCFRYIIVTASCILPALGGAYLTLTQVSRFTENMTNGRGWIAVAAVCLGRLTPLGTFLSCLLFGLASAVSNQLQALNIGVPFQVALMVPYILAILALVSVRDKGHQGPAALGKPYMRKR